jgi:hypothetical protein
MVDVLKNGYGSNQRPDYVETTAGCHHHLRCSFPVTSNK